MAKIHFTDFADFFAVLFTPYYRGVFIRTNRSDYDGPARQNCFSDGGLIAPEQREGGFLHVLFLSHFRPKAHR